MSKVSNVIPINPALLSKSDWERRKHNLSVGYTLIDAGIPVFVTDQEKHPLVLEFNSLDSDFDADARREIIAENLEEQRRKFVKAHNREPVIGKEIRERRFVGATLDKQVFKRMLGAFRTLEPVPSVSVWPAGLAVVDIDERKYPGAIEMIKEAFDSHGRAVADFPNNATRSGGLHIYTRCDTAVESNNVKCDGKLWGDVKGKTQVVAPGAVLATGQTYGSLQDLHRLCSAYKAQIIPPLPQFVADMVGARRASESNSVSEREVRELMADLSDELPDATTLLDAARGGFDMPKIEQRYPAFREAIERGNFSDIIFNLAGALKADRADTTAAEYAAILFERDDCGEFVDDERAISGVSYNRRSVARAWLRAVPLSTEKSTGEAFGNAEEAEAEDERAEVVVKLSQREALTSHLENAIAVADLEGDKVLVSALEAQLKRVKKESDSESECAANHINLTELLAEPETYTRWIVKHFIAFNTTIIAAGLWGSGKTAVYLDIALHIAHGLPWRGRKVEKGIVLYAALENPRDVQSRTRAWCKRNRDGVQFEDTFVLYRGNCSLFDPRDKPTRDERRIIKLANDAAAKLNLPVAMIVIDTVSQAILPGSDREHGSLFVSSMQRIADATGANVTALHHPTKQGDEVRGDGAFQGNTDGVVLLKRDTKTGLGTIKASAQKFRVGDPRKVNFGYKLEPVNVGKDEDGEEIGVVIAVEAAGVSWGVDDGTDDGQNVPPPPDNPTDRPAAILRVIRERIEMIARNTGDALGKITVQVGEVLKLWNVDRKVSGLPEITDPAICSRLLARLVEAKELVRVGENKRSTAYSLPA